MAAEKTIQEKLFVMAFSGIGRVIDRLTQPQFILALGSGIFLWWLTSKLLKGAIPENARELVAALVGFISGQMVGPGWQFYFGTTQGSEKKTSALADNARRATAQGMDLGQGGGKQPGPPVDVNVINFYNDKTDDELKALLQDRTVDPTNMTRDDMLAKLAELDAAKPQETTQ